MPLDPALGGQSGQSGKSVNVFRAAVRIPRVVYGIDADDDGVRVHHFSIAEGKGKKDGIARRDIGDRDAFGRFFRYGDGVVGQR